MTPMASFWCPYCKPWTYCTPCSIDNYEFVIAGWVIDLKVNKNYISLTVIAGNMHLWFLKLSYIILVNSLLILHLCA